jgi:uncharacterized protein (DUF1778 family)
MGMAVRMAADHAAGAPGNWRAGLRRWALALFVMNAAFPAAADVIQPRLFTNQFYVEEATAARTLDLRDAKGVFSFVLSRLPDRVKVYPTENYFYFSFMHGHLPYAGNIRLDVTDRDLGKVHFAYYEDLAEWKDQPPITHVILDAAQGVSVEKLAPLIYRVSYAGKTVVFEINDLSGVKPPPAVLGPEEVYLGPIFDESAIRFFLVYNRRLKIFHYILDETIEVADQLLRAATTDRILIGKRTGFAYYRDHKLDRKILIGVFEGNARVNNYFDGPFDQLPDNFIEGNALHDAIIAVEPHLAGKIDRYGISPDGADRYMISPYRHYRTEEELLIFHSCATDRSIPASLYYACFVFEPDDPGASRPAAPARAKAKKSRAGSNNPPTRK